jgi:hypothetical protein
MSICPIRHQKLACIQLSVLSRVPSISCAQLLATASPEVTGDNMDPLAVPMALPEVNPVARQLPLEPPPPVSSTENCFNFEEMLNCLPQKDRAAFAQHYIEEEVAAVQDTIPTISRAQDITPSYRLVVPQ